MPGAAPWPVSPARSPSGAGWLRVGALDHGLVHGEDDTLDGGDQDPAQGTVHVRRMLDVRDLVGVEGLVDDVAGAVGDA